MRISVKRSDSGYQNYIHARSRLQRTIVKLDGELQTACITADDEAGVIVRYKVGADGAFVFDREREDLVDEVLHGKVEIEFIDESVL